MYTKSAVIRRALTISTKAVGVSLTLMRGGKAETLPEVPEGWILVHQSVWIFTLNRPSHHFNRALAQFRPKNPKLATLEIKHAATFFKLDARHAFDEGKKRLKSSVHELGELAGKVKGGEIHSYHVLKDAFGRAHFALAVNN